MNSSSIRVCATQLGLWCILVIAVVLLTLLFTVLGTITGAVLTGMMMAAARHQRWQTIPVSAVFPGVVIALVGLARVELVGRQRIFLPSLCFAGFWLTYLVTRAVIKLEKPANVPDAPTTTAQSEKTDSEPVKELQLESLQGKWTSGGVNGDARLVLEVSGNVLSLSVVEPEGRSKLVAKGNLKIEG